MSSFLNITGRSRKVWHDTLKNHKKPTNKCCKYRYSMKRVLASTKDEPGALRAHAPLAYSHSLCPYVHTHHHKGSPYMDIGVVHIGVHIRTSYMDVHIWTDQGSYMCVHIWSPYMDILVHIWTLFSPYMDFDIFNIWTPIRVHICAHTCSVNIFCNTSRIWFIYDQSYMCIHIWVHIYECI